jgi:hypothetical protein
MQNKIFQDEMKWYGKEKKTFQDIQKPTDMIGRSSLIT